MCDCEVEWSSLPFLYSLARPIVCVCGGFTRFKGDSILGSASWRQDKTQIQTKEEEGKQEDDRVLSRGGTKGKHPLSSFFVQCSSKTPTEV